MGGVVSEGLAEDEELGVAVAIEEVVAVGVVSEPVTPSSVCVVLVVPTLLVVLVDEVVTSDPVTPSST